MITVDIGKNLKKTKKTQTIIFVCSYKRFQFEREKLYVCLQKTNFSIKFKTNYTHFFHYCTIFYFNMHQNFHFDFLCICRYVCDERHVYFKNCIFRQHKKQIIAFQKNIFERNYIDKT